jgi:hypothetical protein
VYVLEFDFSFATLTAHNPTRSEITSLSYKSVSDDPLPTAERTYHVKRVGDQRQRMHRISDNEFEQEENRVDAQQDHDTRRLGERHGGRSGARSGARARALMGVVRYSADMGKQSSWIGWGGGGGGGLKGSFAVGGHESTKCGPTDCVKAHVALRSSPSVLLRHNLLILVY